MRTVYIITAIFLLTLFQPLDAQRRKSDANIVGHVVCRGEHIPFASVALKGTTIGTATDETGHFQLINLPVGDHTVVVTMVGYETKEEKVRIQKHTTIELKFELEEDVLHLEEVVVSADRSEQKRTEAPVMVNTIGPKIFHSTQSQTIGEGLNFSPGLRLENNCQNCGFSQVRMNGMEGPYSQILINSRPIFSGLAGVYGLELIPSNMIERVEVVRGGGSALFGGNAIAGTVNIILKDPSTNSYEAGATYALSGVGMEGTGGTAPDYSVSLNTSVISDDHKSGLSIYGFNRQRQIFDANGDSFSELAPLENLSIGGRTFHRFSNRDRLALDFFAIYENREGGNMQDYPLHERDIAEALTHHMKVAGLTYERYFRTYDMLSLYASGQFLKRDSYYGARQALDGYGASRDNSYNLGIQYKAVFNKSSLVSGIENNSGFLVDQKLGYGGLPPTMVADQSSVTTGLFAQYDLKLKRFKAALGGRFDHYQVRDRAGDGNSPASGNVFSPRLSLFYHLSGPLQARLSYSQGYRAPQIFDEDLHIETSGSRQVIHRNDPDLKQESSHSVMASLDFNKNINGIYTGILIEGFYTRLMDAFANEFGEPDADGIVIYTRVNSEGGAWVQGLNMEFKLRPARDFSLTSGFTVQSSQFEEAQDFNETRFFRSPNSYGFLALDWDFAPRFSLAGTGNYTGKMLVPYFGTENPEGELRTSDPFLDLGLKLKYTVKLNGASVEFSGGIKNILNAYQYDFDSGIDRDPAYIYGPLAPRTVFVGIRFGNLLRSDGRASLQRQDPDQTRPGRRRGQGRQGQGRGKHRYGQIEK